MKPKTLLLATVALGFGLGASYLTGRLSASREAERIEAGLFPLESLPTDGVVDVNELADRVVAVDLANGKAIREGDLRDKTEVDRQPIRIDGYRAVGLRVDRAYVEKGQITPRSRVDLVTTGGPSPRVLLRDVLVLSIDGNTCEPDCKPGYVATLAIKPGDASRLSKCSSAETLAVVPSVRIDVNGKSITAKRSLELGEFVDDLGKTFDVATGKSSDPEKKKTNAEKQRSATRKLPAGFRAVGLRVNRGQAEVGKTALPNSRVDVINTVRREGEKSSYSHILLENVLMLETTCRGSVRDDNGRPIPANPESSIETFALSLEDCERLRSVQELGTLTIVIRKGP